jgi:hypothetical protein
VPVTTVEETSERVRRILVDYKGRVEIDASGFSYVSGSTRVFIRVSQISEGFTMVSVYAFPLLDVQFTDELYKWIALTSDTFRFGHLGLSENDDKPGYGAIVFAHNLLGDFLDPEELRWAIDMIASTTDRLDDELKPKYGGRRAVED